MTLVTVSLVSQGRIGCGLAFAGRGFGEVDTSNARGEEYPEESDDLEFRRLGHSLSTVRERVSFCLDLDESLLLYRVTHQVEPNLPLT